MNRSLILFVSAALVSQSNAVITAGSTEVDIAFADVGGLPIRDGTGFIASGYFSGLDDSSISSSDIDTISDAFTQFTSDTGEFGQGGFDGLFSYSSGAERIGAGSPFLNQSLYFIFGNGGTLQSSVQLAVFKSELSFANDSAASADLDLTVKFGGADQSPGTFLMGVTGGMTTLATTSGPS